MSRMIARSVTRQLWTSDIVERDDAGANALNTAAVGFNFLSRIRF